MVHWLQFWLFNSLIGIEQMIINNSRAGRFFVFITDQFKRGRKGYEGVLLRSGSVIPADQDLNKEIKG